MKYRLMMLIFVVLVSLYSANGTILKKQSHPPVAPSQQSEDTRIPSGLIVYSAQVDSQEYTHGRGSYDLFLQTTGDDKVARLTDHRAHPQRNLGGAITEPRFSPDGKRILFLADYADSVETLRIMHTDAVPYPNSYRNIWLLDLPTKTITAITKGNLGWGWVRWSPDGRYFCATYPSREGALQDIPPDDIYLFDASTLQKRRIARATDRVTYLFWSADSKSLVFQEWRGDDSFYKVSISGGRPRIAVEGENNRADYTLSPNGEQAAFVRYTAGPGNKRTDSLYLLHKTSLKAIKIMEGVSNRSMPVLNTGEWSPDGKRLSITRQNEKDLSTELYVLEAQAGKLRLVTTLPEPAGVNSWYRDGRWWIVHLLKASSKEGMLAIFLADGHRITLHAPNEITHGLDWHEDIIKPAAIDWKPKR